MNPCTRTWNVSDNFYTSISVYGAYINFHSYNQANPSVKSTSVHKNIIAVRKPENIVVMFFKKLNYVSRPSPNPLNVIPKVAYTRVLINRTGEFFDGNIPFIPGLANICPVNIYTLYWGNASDLSTRLAQRGAVAQQKRKKPCPKTTAYPKRGPCENKSHCLSFLMCWRCHLSWTGLVDAKVLPANRIRKRTNRLSG